MFRYYMTPETQQAVIAESNRLIALRAAMAASRTRREAVGGIADRDTLETQARPEPSDVESESAFARLVADLQSSAGRSIGEASAAHA